jgi:hypothetical protein
MADVSEQDSRPRTFIGGSGRRDPTTEAKEIRRCAVVDGVLVAQRSTDVGNQADAQHSVEPEAVAYRRSRTR